MNKWILVLTTVSLISCNQKQEESDIISEDTAITESVSTALSSLADEQSGASMARAENPLITLLLPRAVADSCQRPFYVSCQSGFKSETYDSCPLYLGKIDGEAQLAYSNGSCSLTTAGQSVSRSYDFTVTGPRGGTYYVTSDTAQDYKGDTYGGGEVLSKTMGGWTVDILGRHKSFVSRRGREAYNVSLRTLQAYTITGSLSRSSRLVNGGQIEVNHNLAGLTALIEPNQVQWSSSCCHPVSGSLTITYSGSRTGSASIEFLGCGAAQIVRAGQIQNIGLSYCE